MGFVRVALISHEGGGISSVCRGLANSLVKKGVDVTIFTDLQGITKPKIEELNDLLRIVYLPSFYVPPRSTWFQFRNLSFIMKFLKEQNIIHGVSPDASFLFSFLKRKLDKPFIVTIHGCPRAIQRVFLQAPISCWTLGDFSNHMLKFPLDDFITKRCLFNANHTVVCSFSALNDLKKFYKNLDANKISVIYNGIDFDEIKDFQYSKKNTNEDFTIIYAGRLFWTKGVMWLLEAFKILSKNFRNVKLKIFGAGPLEKEIRKFICYAGLKDRVNICYRIPHNELIMELMKADIAVLPSLYEAQSMFVLEAMACKKPVILFDVPFAQELVSHMDSAILAKACDVKDLYKKIEMFLLDRKLRVKYGNSAYRYVRRYHNWDTLVDKYIQVYKSVLKIDH